MFIGIIKLLSSFHKKAVIYFENNKKCGFPFIQVCKALFIQGCHSYSMVYVDN